MRLDTSAQPRLCRQMRSARQSRYGIQPTWSSLKVILTLGKRTSSPENNQSASPCSPNSWVSAEETAGGASGEVDGIFEPDPLCMQITVPVSSQARTNGSQWRASEWIEGRPSSGGCSDKHTARTPRAA